MANVKNNSLSGNRSKLVRSESESSSAPKVSNLSSALRSVSLSAKPPGSSISFGKPSSAGGTSTSSSSSVLTSLLKQTASGGIASALGGGLGGLLSLGSIVSGFVHLFGGGKTTPPPLVQFQAPASRDVVSYVGSGGRSGASSPSATSSTTNVADGHAGGSNYQFQSSQIAQAVKQALLNSNSLNDVIAEI